MINLDRELYREFAQKLDDLAHKFMDDTEAVMTAYSDDDKAATIAAIIHLILSNLVKRTWPEQPSMFIGIIEEIKFRFIASMQGVVSEHPEF